MKVELREVFVDDSGRWVLCWDAEQEYFRMRLKPWDAIRWALRVKLRHLLHLPTFPVWVPDGAVVETGQALQPRNG
jgi:hypothetical protein